MAAGATGWEPKYQNTGSGVWPTRSLSSSRGSSSVPVRECAAACCCRCRMTTAAVLSGTHPDAAAATHQRRRYSHPPLCHAHAPHSRWSDGTAGVSLRRPPVCRSGSGGVAGGGSHVTARAVRQPGGAVSGAPADRVAKARARRGGVCVGALPPRRVAGADGRKSGRVVGSVARVGNRQQLAGCDGCDTRDDDGHTRTVTTARVTRVRTSGTHVPHTPD